MSTSGSPDGSETAEHINSFVSSCTHDRTPTSEIDALAEAEELVSAARRCLQAAQSLIDARAHRDLIEDYLKESEASVDQANGLLEKAMAEEQLAEGAETAAAVTAGTWTRLGPIGLAERAQDQVGEAKGLVASDNSRMARKLKDQCDDIRNRARAILAQLG